MNKIIISVLSFLCVGCSSLLYESDFNAKPKTEMILVSWFVVDDVDKKCREVGAKSPIFFFINGCARYSRDHFWCEIYTNKETSHEILGHELRHCFEGSFH